MSDGKNRLEFTSMDEMTINISAFRLLYIYKLLSQAVELSIQDLNTHLINHPLIDRAVTSETLNKYIHTLRLFGCKIERLENQNQVFFRLSDHPLKPELSLLEMNALKNIAEILQQQPLSIYANQFSKLVPRLAVLPDAPDSWLLNAFEVTLQSGLSQEDYQVVKQFQKYCFEGQVLEIRHLNHDHTMEVKRIEPRQVIYEKKSLYLSGKDPLTHKKVRYALTQILSHRQLPHRVQSQPVKVSVTFKLTGRLAASYRPYPGESIVSNEEGLTITHVTDEVDVLIRRLLKYGPSCQILSPESARKEMLNQIEHLLEKMREDLDILTEVFLSKEQTDGSRHKWAYYYDSPQTMDDVAAD